MRHLPLHIRLAVGMFLTLAVLLAACGSGSTSTSSAPSPTTPAQASVAGTFVGTVNQTSGSLQANFGLVSNGQRFIAYLCDGGVNTPVNGHAKEIMVAQWFKGVVTNNAIKVTNAQGSQLVATLTVQSTTGTVTLSDGRTFSLQLPVLLNTSPVGTYHDIPGVYRDEETFGGVRYLAGAVIRQGISYSTTFMADLYEPLAPSYRPWIHGGGLINEQTGALACLPEPANGTHDGVQVSVQGLGTFTLHLAQP